MPVQQLPKVTRIAVRSYRAGQPVAYWRFVTADNRIVATARKVPDGYVVKGHDFQEKTGTLAQWHVLGTVQTLAQTARLAREHAATLAVQCKTHGCDDPVVLFPTGPNTYEWRHKRSGQRLCAVPVKHPVATPSLAMHLD